MSYLDESKLSAYNSSLKEWVSSQDSKTITSSIYPWTKTAKASAVSCYSVGGTELKPVVDFLFTETPPASGDKGPENPSIITGVSSVNVGRVGKNLLLAAAGTSSNYTLVRNSDGSLSINGSGSAMFAVTDSGAGSSGIKSSVVLDTSKYYTLSVEVVSGTASSAPYTPYVSIVSQSATEIILPISSSEKSSKTFTYNSVDGRFVCRIIVGSSGSFTNAVLKIQLEEGDTATSFEAPMFPADANHVLSLGSTYYGGSLDVALGVMTVTHVAVTPDASTVDISSAPAVIPIDYADTFGRTITSADGMSLSVGSAGGTVVYRLATPQTVQLSPTEIFSLVQTDKYTPRFNTVHTDAQAIQVGYVKSPIREEYELQQAIVSQGGNI